MVGEDTQFNLMVTEFPAKRDERIACPSDHLIHVVTRFHTTIKKKSGLGLISVQYIFPRLFCATFATLVTVDFKKHNFEEILIKTRFVYLNAYNVLVFRNISE